MKYIGATVGFGIEVEAENSDQAATLILEEARKLLPGKDPFIIEMDAESEWEDVGEEEDEPN